jgi:hypothetical protein
MSKDYEGDSSSLLYGESTASRHYEGAEEGQLGSQWESTNRKMLGQMIKELETEHFLTPEAIARVLHIREDYLQMILEQVGKEGEDK